jgi:Prokaryotic phospholipase A2
MNKAFGVLALTLVFAACSTAPLPPQADAPIPDPTPTITASDLAKLETDATSGFADAPSVEDVDAANRELEADRAVFEGDPDFKGEIPAPNVALEDALATLQGVNQARLRFVNGMIATPLDRFWAMRQNPGYHRGGYAWVNWSTDGCSGYSRAFPLSRFLKGLLDVVWFRACVQHDFGYRNYKDVLGIKNMKTQAAGYKRFTDQRFLDGMNWTCDRTFPSWNQKHLKIACRYAAVKVYRFVQNYGT